MPASAIQSWKDGGRVGPTRILRGRRSMFWLDELQPHPDNARRGDLEVIGGSIEDNSSSARSSLSAPPGHVLVGKHRLVAARERGATVLPVLWVDVDDDRARRIMLVENRSNDVAGYDDATLAQVLELLGGDYAGPGFDDAAAAEILAAAVFPPQLDDPDEAPDLADAGDVVTREGDVWILGPQRLVCGSVTSAGSRSGASRNHRL